MCDIITIVLFLECEDDLMFNTNFIIESFFKNRNLSFYDLDYYSNPQPEHQHDALTLFGVNDFVENLHQLKDKHITIVPDYDADGVLSGTLARVALSLFGFNHVSLYPPHTRDGYGLTKHSVDMVLSMYPETDVILTTDNGSNAIDGIAYAKSKDLIVFVTDHHLSEEPSGANFEVNPNRRYINEPYVFPSISGTTVTFKVLEAYVKLYVTDQSVVRHFDNLIILVGLSVVSDVMPMLDENRYFVIKALSLFNYLISIRHRLSIMDYDNSPIGQFYRGLLILLDTLDQNDRLKHSFDVDTFGFLLAPMLNSPRRMIGDSTLGFQLFQTEITDIDTVWSVGDDIYKLNNERKLYTDHYSRVLLDYVSTDFKGLGDVVEYCVMNAVVRSGIVGLLAGRFMTHFNLPSIVFSIDGVDQPSMNSINVDLPDDVLISGSARSPLGFDLYSFLADIDMNHPGLIDAWGGHAQAAGITIRASNFETFRSVFVDHYRKHIALQSVDASKSDLMLPVMSEFLLTTSLSDSFAQQGFMLDSQVEVIPISSDQPIMQCDFLLDALSFFDRLQPYGHAFEKPDFGIMFRMSDGVVKYMGTKSQHVKVTLLNGLSIICWNSADSFLSAIPETIFIVTGLLSINEFAGRQTLQLISQNLDLY